MESAQVGVHSSRSNPGSIYSIANKDPTEMKSDSSKPAWITLMVAASTSVTGIALAARAQEPGGPTCQPGHEQVAVFAASGRCMTLDVNTYPTTAAAGLGDEPIASIVVGSGVAAIVCGIDGSANLECEELRFSKQNHRPQLPWTYLKVMDVFSKELRCRPNDTEVVIYGDFFARGPCIRLGPGKYESAQKVGLASGDTDPFISDRKTWLQSLRNEGTLLVKSHRNEVRAGRKVQAIACDKEYVRDPGRECHSKLRRSGSYSGIVGSVYVWEYCYPEANQVAVFAEPNEFGACTIRDIGEYPTASSIMEQGLLGHSLRLGPDVQATICTDEHLQGDCVDVERSGVVDHLVGSLVVRAGQRAPRPR